MYVAIIAPHVVKASMNGNAASVYIFNKLPDTYADINIDEMTITCRLILQVFTINLLFMHTEVVFHE